MKIELKKQKMQKKLNRLKNAWNAIDIFCDSVLDEDAMDVICAISCILGISVAVITMPFTIKHGLLVAMGVVIGCIAGVGILAYLPKGVLSLINRIIEKRYDKIERKLEKLNSLKKDNCSTKNQIIKECTKQAKIEQKQEKTKIKEKEKLVRKLIKLKKSQKTKDEKIQSVEEKLEEYQELNV